MDNLWKKDANSYVIMKEKLIYAIKQYWHENIFPGFKMKDFMREVLPIYAQLDTLCSEPSKYTVGIMIRNRVTWIAVYIASLLKGCTVAIIHPNMSRAEIAHYILIAEMNIIFVDDSLKENFLIENALPMLKAVYNAESFNYRWFSNSIKNDVISAKEFNNKNVFIDYNQVDLIFNERYTNDVETIITPTSGVENGFPNYVVSSATSINALINKAIDIFPYDMGDTIYCNAPFETSHYISVLIPFIKGCVFTVNPRHANVFIEDTPSFERLWRNRVDSLLERNFLNFLFVKQSMKRLFSWIAVRRLKSYYNRGEKLKAVILYNWFGAERIISTVKGKLPIMSTYGSQECNQLIAYNDYSSKAAMSPNCVGYFIRGMEYKVDTDNEELLLASKSLFVRYLSDLDWTDEKVDDLWYHTGDCAAVLFEDLLFIYGRQQFLVQDNFGFAIHLDDMERIIKNSPFVKEALLLPYKDQTGNLAFKLAVYPDEAFAESRNMNLNDYREHLRIMVKMLNNRFVTSIDYQHILPEPLTKTFDNKVERHLYNTLDRRHSLLED